MLRTYDPSTVHLLVGGFPIGGFASGAVIKVTATQDRYEKIEGIGGVITRARNLNKSGEISITLEQTSESNAVLSGIMIADQINNSGIVPILLADTASFTTIISAFCWIKKQPDLVYSSELSQREWVFSVTDIEAFIGGNRPNE